MPAVIQPKLKLQPIQALRRTAVCETASHSSTARLAICTGHQVSGAKDTTVVAPASIAHKSDQRDSAGDKTGDRVAEVIRVNSGEG